MASKQNIPPVDSLQPVGHPTHPKFLNLTGNRYASWTVLYYVGMFAGETHKWWMCQCQCGTLEPFRSNSLVRGRHRPHCGCIKPHWDKSHLTLEQLRAANEIIECPPEIIDRTGQQFGLLTVAGLAGRLESRTYWWCQCECGGRSCIEGHSITMTESCGCYASMLASARLTTHGKCKTPEDFKMLLRWHAMIARCHNPESAGYERYGARGIGVCQRWRDSVAVFIEDVGYPPAPGYSLDRYPNNNGNYEPGNVRWATATEQQRNRRDNINIARDGVTKCLKEWCDILGLNYATINGRISRLGWEPNDALDIPVIPINDSRRREPCDVA